MVIIEARCFSIEVSTGKYEANNKTYECDLVLENASRIMFIESKAKALTKAARAGFDIAIIKDLMDSLVYGIIQSGRHSHKIAEDKSIPLINSTNEEVTIDLAGRQLERLTITLHDFGGFQDRMVIDQILTNHVQIKYHAVDPANESKFNSVNKKLTELYKNYIELYKQAGSPENPHLFFNCWFLSVPQFLIILDDVTDDESLEHAIKATRHITFSSKDFYFELKCARQIKT